MSEVYNRVSSILDKTFLNLNKRKVNCADDNSYLNFSCPYCGDSHRNELKKRGYLYFNSLFYICFNCGVKVPMHVFLSDFGEGIKDPKIIKQIEEQIAKNILQSNSFSSEFVDYVKNYSINRQEFELQNLIERCNVDNKWLNGRLLQNKFIYFSEKIGVHYIYNLVGDSFIGMQVRNPFSDVKYKSYNLSRIYKKYYNEDVFEKVKIIDKYSLVFNFFNISFNRPIFVLEGPIDSFFFDNSIALCGVNKRIDFLDSIDNVKFAFDNDEPGRSKMESLLKSGRSVFMWKKVIKDLRISDQIKDINDLVIYCNERNIKINLENYFTKIKLDLLYV